MLRRLLLLALMCALAAPASAAAEVTIATGKNVRDISYGDAVRVKGKTGTYRGSVTLEVDEFPYDGNYVDSQTVSTNDKGEYVFPKVGPNRNARLRARIAGPERSKAIEVFVYARAKLKRRQADANHDYDRVTLSLSGPPGYTVPQDQLYIYMLKSGKRTYQRLGGARTMSNPRDGVYTYTGLVRLPSTKHGYRYGLYFCVKGAPAGWGRDFPEQRACGEKRVDVRD